MIEIQGIETPVLFPEWVPHDTIWNRMNRPPVVSAGFCTEDFDCYGESVSLDKKSRSVDSSIVQSMMTFTI